MRSGLNEFRTSDAGVVLDLFAVDNSGSCHGFFHPTSSFRVIGGAGGILLPGAFSKRTFAESWQDLTLVMPHVATQIFLADAAHQSPLLYHLFLPREQTQIRTFTILPGGAVAKRVDPLVPSRRWVSTVGAKSDDGLLEVYRPRNSGRIRRADTPISVARTNV